MQQKAANGGEVNTGKVCSGGYHSLCDMPYHIPKGVQEKIKKKVLNFYGQGRETRKEFIL